MTLLMSVAALGSIAWGGWLAMNSALFSVQVVEIGDARDSEPRSGLDEVLPVDAAAISKLAAVSIGNCC